MGDMVRNSNLLTMLTYLFFLTSERGLRHDPISVLVAVLLTLGVMSKQNEITAFKACGVSLYRLALPLIVTCIVLSGSLLAFDYQYVPAANRRQEALRDRSRAGRNRAGSVRTISGKRATARASTITSTSIQLSA